jgi:hypothetical protein
VRRIEREGSEELKAQVRSGEISVNKAHLRIPAAGGKKKEKKQTPPVEKKWHLRPETQAATVEKLTSKYPDYAEYALAHLGEPQRSDFLRRCKTAQDLGRPIRWPLPSEVFPGVNPGLDDRLVRQQQNQNIPMLEAMAKLPSEDQAEFYERYLKNPQQAQLWASVPRWKRPIIAGDPQDVLIWKFFTIIRLELEYWASRSEEGLRAGLHAQGYQLCQKAGLLYSITDIKRLSAVLSMYGFMLQKGSDLGALPEYLGNVTEPPWKNGR